jgi:signal transduction histidine kinase
MLAARKGMAMLSTLDDYSESICERDGRPNRLGARKVDLIGIAHDFNNLLNPILMSVRLLQMNRPEDERQRLLKILQASAERGAEMVKRLLAETGQ